MQGVSCWGRMIALAGAVILFSFGVAEPTLEAAKHRQEPQEPQEQQHKQSAQEGKEKQNQKTAETKAEGDADQTDSNSAPRIALWIKELGKGFWGDQKQIWTSPAQLRLSDANWLVPASGFAAHFHYRPRFQRPAIERSRHHRSPARLTLLRV